MIIVINCSCATISKLRLCAHICASFSRETMGNTSHLIILIVKTEYSKRLNKTLRKSLKCFVKGFTWKIAFCNEPSLPGVDNKRFINVFVDCFLLSNFTSVQSSSNA